MPSLVDRCGRMDITNRRLAGCLAPGVRYDTIRYDALTYILDLPARLRALFCPRCCHHHIPLSFCEQPEGPHPRLEPKTKSSEIWLIWSGVPILPGRLLWLDRRTKEQPVASKCVGDGDGCGRQALRGTVIMHFIDRSNGKHSGNHTCQKVNVTVLLGSLGLIIFFSFIFCSCVATKSLPTV